MKTRRRKARRRRAELSADGGTGGRTPTAPRSPARPQHHVPRSCPALPPSCPAAPALLSGCPTAHTERGAPALARPSSGPGRRVVRRRPE